MIIYTSWPFIIINMKAIRPTTSQELHTQTITIIENAWTRSSPITPTKIVKSKWQDNMINFTSWTIILPNIWKSKS